MSWLTQRRLSLLLRIIGVISPGLAAEIAVWRFTTPIPIPRPEWEKELIAKGQPIQFKNGTVGTVWGPKEAPAIMLVHGWQGRGAQLGKLVEPLLEQGFRVVAWDGPAHGDSPGRRANLRLFAELLSGAANELGPIRAIVAHSFGAGATALALSQGWMEVQRVVLVAAPAEFEWVVAGYSRRFKVLPKVEAAFRRKFENLTGLSIAEMGIAKLAEKIETPALVIHDEDDDEVPFSDGQKIVHHWRGSKLIALKGVGHRRILKSPQFIEAVVNFVGRAT